MKKIVLVSATTISLLLACGAGKNGPSDCNNCGKSEKPITKPSKMKTSNNKKGSPFLITKGLPHMTKLVKQNWDNPTLALTTEQKEKLLIVRKNVMGMVARLTPEVVALRKEIVQVSHASTNREENFQENVKKLAALEAEATLGHLGCISQTKAILTPAQTAFLLSSMK